MIMLVRGYESYYREDNNLEGKILQILRRLIYLGPSHSEVSPLPPEHHLVRQEGRNEDITKYMLVYKDIL